MICYFYDKILTVERLTFFIFTSKSNVLQCLSASFNKYLFATSLTLCLLICKCIKIVLMIMHLNQYFTVYSLLLKIYFAAFSLLNYQNIILDLGVFTGFYWQLLLPGKYCILVRLHNIVIIIPYYKVLLDNHLIRKAFLLNVCHHKPEEL